MHKNFYCCYGNKCDIYNPYLLPYLFISCIRKFYNTDVPDGKVSTFKQFFQSVWGIFWIYMVYNDTFIQCLVSVYDLLCSSDNVFTEIFKTTYFADGRYCFYDFASAWFGDGYAWNWKNYNKLFIYFGICFVFDIWNNM